MNATLYDLNAWTVFYGQTNGWITMADSAGRNFTRWVPQSQQGNLYFYDVDSSFDFSNLRALNGTNDLSEADSALNMTGFNDSIRKVFDTNNDGVADSTDCFEIGYRTVCNVPVVNSTDGNNGNFVTGVLWDAGDGGTEYDGTQDLVFITRINEDKAGSYGTYDYEVRLPAKLRDLKGSDSRLEMYMEIK